MLFFKSLFLEVFNNFFQALNFIPLLCDNIGHIFRHNTIFRIRRSQF